MVRFRFLTLLSFALGTIFVSGSGYAHFNLNANIRTIHIVHTSNGLDVYLRLPTPIFLAGLAGEDTGEGTPAPAPFTYNRIETDVLMHYVDVEKVRLNPNEFAQFVVDGMSFETENERLIPTIRAVRMYAVLEQPPFSSLTEAKRAFQGDAVVNFDGELYVGETVTDVYLHYEHSSSVDSFTFQDHFQPNLEFQDSIANLILDHYPGSTRIHKLTGLRHEPVKIENSEVAAIATFIFHGMKHILEGLDHVLFVLCLTVGAVSLGSVIWRVTGFTVGHTFTLIAGFLGFVPSAAWFVPTVEAFIAISIIYMGVVALQLSEKPERAYANLGITIFIGLFHGFGFSFILHELLLPNSAHLWKVLLSFNVGVELGQIAIVVGMWLTMWGIKRFKANLLNIYRWIVVTPCVFLASIWTIERIGTLFRAISVT